MPFLKELQAIQTIGPIVFGTACTCDGCLHSGAVIRSLLPGPGPPQSLICYNYTGEQNTRESIPQRSHMGGAEVSNVNLSRKRTMKNKLQISRCTLGSKLLKFNHGSFGVFPLIHNMG